jgi:hypothetical protein
MDQYVNSLRDRYGVDLRFPGADVASDVITISGPEKMVAKAKAELMELYEEEVRVGRLACVLVLASLVHRLTERDAVRGRSHKTRLSC